MTGRPLRLTWIACLMLALSACAFPGTGEPSQLYTLTPKSTFEPNLPKVEWQLVIERPVASSGLNSQRIALQRSPVTVDYFARANWTDSAPLLIQTLLIESFENTGKIAAVTRESSQLRADYILQTELREFQAEYDKPNAAPTVRVRLNGKLIRMTDRTIVGSETVERSVQAEKPDMESVVLAFDEALGKVMKRIVEWTLPAPGTAARPGRGG
jgi:cholesterol transport system auxiliary component